MKFAKKILFAVMLFAFTLTLASCSEDNKELFKAVQQNMSEQLSYELDMTVDLGMRGMGSTSSVTTTGHIEVDLESATKGVMKLTMNSQGQTITQYYDMKDTSVDVYASSFGSWSKETMTIAEFNQTGTTISSEEYIQVLENYSSSRTIKTETLSDGTKVKVFELKIDGRALFEESFGADFGQLLQTFTKDEITSLFSNLVYKISIDEEAKLIRKIEMDMEPILDKMVKMIEDKYGSSSGLEFTKALITMEFSNFNNVNVTIPDSVKNAASSGF